MKKVVETTKAPAAIGPYSQAVINERLLFSAGQLGIDPTTGNLVAGGVAEQTVQVMENLGAVLETGLSSYDKILKTTIYLVNMNDFAVVNEIYARYFHDKPPARSTVQVAALPKGGLVEIDCIAATV